MKSLTVLQACYVFLIEGLKILCGFCLILGGIITVLLSIPGYTYRFFLSRIASRYYSATLGKIVDAPATLFAVEFLPSFRHLSPKCVIVTTMVADGKWSVNETRKLIEERWVSFSDYPELKQYVERWNGFLFWKNDLNFSIENHVRSHELEGHSDSEFDENQRQFVRNLLNKPFHPKRSPWEWFVIKNYKNASLEKESEHGEMTLNIFRFHHCLGDGYSFARALMEKLIETPFETPFDKLPPSQPSAFWSKDTFLAALYLPLQFSLDMRNVFELFYASQLYTRKTPLHALDEEDSLNYKKHAVCIPIKRIKEIKKKLGVSFTGVLLAALSAGITKLLQKKNKTNEVTKTVKLFVVLPLPGRPTKLQNHLTATYIELPTIPNMHPVDRVGNIETELKHARQNTLPLMYPLLVQAFGSLLPSLAAFLLKIRFSSVGLSNFPGPPGQVRYNGRKCLMADFISGTLVGTIGVYIHLCSYEGQVRIATTFGKKCLDVIEADVMMRSIVDEINILYEL
ncbi:O-acyltransferase WSD1 [Orchesella cincta]|uniref:O-acyltransferase WSD1 n=1 Tax=Orchesella cincta TaxID=48709 RepID=A0A1D2MD43_ORCCI|nr:O-acyltransferase WSD1 [Orchesella cincta]